MCVLQCTNNEIQAYKIVVMSVKSVPHFQNDAKFEISAIVNDGGATTSVFNRAISHPNGSFSQS